MGSRGGALLLVLLLAGCARPADDPWNPTFSQALLWDMFYEEIVVEVDHIDGRRLEPSALKGALEELRSLTGRQVRLGSEQTIPLRPNDQRVWSHDDFMELHFATLDDAPDDSRFGSGRSAILHVLSLDGRGGGATTPLGTAWENVAVIFTDELAGMQPLGRAHPNYALDAQRILTHEMGHTVGLVGCDVPMVRPHDNDGDCHSAHQTSVMFPRHGRMASTLELAQPGHVRLRFDEDDRADIEAYIELGRRCAIDPGCGAKRAATE